MEPKKMRNLHKRKGEEGFALLSSYLAISVMLIFALGVFMRTFVFGNVNEQNQNRLVAFQFAESGVDQTVIALKDQNAAFADNFSRYPCANDYDANNDGINEGCSTAFNSMDSAGSEVLGGYEIWVNDPINSGSVYRHIRVSGQTPVNGNATTVGQCTGATSTQRGFGCRAVEAYVELDDTLFEHAIFSEGDLTMNGTSPLIDSYDSSQGAYGGANVGNNGDIGSNGSLAGGEITLNGSPTINGAIHESLGIECPAVSANPPIGSMGALRVNGEESLPPAINNVYRYDSLTVQSNNGLLHIGTTDVLDPMYGQTITIYIDGDFTVSAGEIQAHNPVVFYVGGEINLAGNGVTTSGNDPANLIIYGTGTEPISVSGGSEFHGAIFAPDSEISLNGGIDFYGAMFGSAFDGNGAGSVHYDQMLEGMKLPCTIVRFRAWREIEALLTA